MLIGSSFKSSQNPRSTLPKCCDALQCKLRRIGYVIIVLPPPVGKALHRRVDYTVKKVNQASNGNIHRAVRSKYWVCLSLHPDEIFREPDGVIEGLSKREKELVTENQRPWAEIEGNSVFIPSTFEAMRYVCHQPEVHTIGLHFYRSEPDQTTIFFFFKIKHHSSMTLWSSSLLFRNRTVITDITEEVRRHQQQRHVRK